MSAPRLEKLLKVNGTRSADSFHRELGLLLWDKCGMSRNEQGLREALRKIPELRDEFWRDVRVPGDEEDYNQSLERAGRVADFLEFAELMCIDALERDESAARIFARNIKRPMAKRSETTRAMQLCSRGNFKATVSLRNCIANSCISKPCIWPSAATNECPCIRAKSNLSN